MVISKHVQTVDTRLSFSPLIRKRKETEAIEAHDFCDVI